MTPTREVRAVRCLASALALAVLAAAGSAAAAQAKARARPTVRIDVLSNRADLISGGEALVAISPAGRSTLVTLNGKAVSSLFATRADGRYEGLVTGLRIGNNVLIARQGRRAARITIVDHSLGGPVLAGQQVEPWICAAGTVGKQCSEPSTVSWFYKSAMTGTFAAYDPSAPPPSANIAEATTTDGVTVPYIVREESGSMDRGFYDVAVLADPAKPWSRWTPYAGWNRKVVWEFGSGSNPNYSQQPADDILDDNALSHGFMTAENSLNIHGDSTNDTVGAEAMMMLKEHIVDSYGDIRYVIGEGCSGGGLEQYMLTNMYPGLLNGIIPSCSFPDLWSEATEVGDCYLLYHYFTDVSPSLWPDPSQQFAVQDKGPYDGCQIWNSTYSSLLDPTDANSFKSCGVPHAEVYNATSNPRGVRCTIQDYQIDVWGRRPRSAWGPVEKEIGHGFAQRPYQNVGVMYGLQPLLAGEISAGQFVDLNEKVGGLDIDAVPVAQRSVADPSALVTAYRSGQISDGRQWADVPIIDLRGHSTMDWHQDYNSYESRARLDAANGGHGNQVIWTGEAPIAGDPAFSCSLGPLSTDSNTPETPASACSADPLLAMDRWLTRVYADQRTVSLARKIVSDRPADVVDACWVGGERITDMTTCHQAYPYYGSPRMAAGESIRNDILACRLEPLRAAEFPGVTFTADQWAGLQKAFPGGVCDWAEPGIDQQPSIPWMTFARGPGGEPLGPPPASKALRRAR